MYLYGGKKFIGEDYFEVLPETVGQFTGLQDKNGKEIYENHAVITRNIHGVKIIGTVVFEKGMFCLKYSDGYVNNWHLNPERYEIHTPNQNGNTGE